MNPAPPTYDHEFYKREIEGQKSRLARLKSRQETRQRKFGTRPKAADNRESGDQKQNALKQRTEEKQIKQSKDAKPPPPSSHKESLNLDPLVLEAMDTLQLPCSIDDVLQHLSQKNSKIEKVAVVEAVKALASAEGLQRLEIEENKDGIKIVALLPKQATKQPENKEREQQQATKRQRKQ